ncbi:hypothetical protein B6U90_00810 [Thermoplasmatales archaeon ex4484_6]|nr:MAG: hypothetical protein B6U90_00810 [Thermoplasmatales archaeon ex4484_6]RLF68254.1 MAG: hypothetical protein DRN57_04630 [Thermoplasmata archaeon]
MIPKGQKRVSPPMMLTDPSLFLLLNLIRSLAYVDLFPQNGQVVVVVSFARSKKASGYPN